MPLGEEVLVERGREIATH